MVEVVFQMVGHILVNVQRVLLELFVKPVCIFLANKLCKNRHLKSFHILSIIFVSKLLVIILDTLSPF